ncbi:MAG: hypothetical protein ABMA64_36735 [Myxococcota bacterium]
MGSIAVLERNRTAAARIARIVAAAADARPLVVGPDPHRLEAQLDGPPALLACDADDLDAARTWLDRWPGLRLLLWCRDPRGPNPPQRSLRAVLDLARDEPRIRNVLGWQAGAPSPRPSELAMVVRRLLTPDLPLPPLDRLVPWGGFRAVYRPATAAERDEAVNELSDRLLAIGVNERSAARAAEVAHELVTNATFTAPIDGWGRPKYARDRRAPITVEAREVPTMELVCDGQQLAVEVSDAFGRLKDEHVLASVIRTIDNAMRDDDSRGPMLDTGGGGAGLGLGLVYASCVAMITEVVPGRSTRVAWFHDLDLHPREYRGLPASVHLFRAEPAQP